jgi:hypothetical protein
VNLTNEAKVILGTLVGIVVVFTLISNGSLKLGTSSSGPFFSTGFKGPQGPQI